MVPTTPLASSDRGWMRHSAVDEFPSFPSSIQRAILKESRTAQDSSFTLSIRPLKYRSIVDNKLVTSEISRCRTSEDLVSPRVRKFRRVELCKRSLVIQSLLQYRRRRKRSGLRKRETTDEKQTGMLKETKRRKLSRTCAEERRKANAQP